MGGEQAVTRAFERLLLDEFAPPAVMVNAEGKIVYVSGATGRFLQLPGGMTRTNVVDMALPALRPGLHTALHRAVQSGKPATQEGLTVELDGALRRVDVIVRPIADASAERGLFVIVFREAGSAPSDAASAAPPAEGELAADLERELQRTREHLQTTVEELEAGSEELQSANEELLSTNEELQSANEELQTSKEEQQSVNEELQTVNVELVRKVEELDCVNGDLKNLFASTHIATLFLDDQLRIQALLACGDRDLPHHRRRRGAPHHRHRGRARRRRFSSPRCARCWPRSPSATARCSAPTTAPGTSAASALIARSTT